MTLFFVRRWLLSGLGVVLVCFLVTCGGGSDVSRCEANTDCMGSSDGPVCDTTSGRCVQCLTSEHCDGNPQGNLCDPTTHTCVGGEGCTGNQDCAGNPDGEVCDMSTGECVECLTNPDCAGNPSGGVCESLSRSCVECVNANDCAGNPSGPICGPNHTCGPESLCTGNDDCTGDPEHPVCDTQAGRCVQCLNWSDCQGHPSGEVCDPATHTCTGETENCSGPADCAQNAVRVLCDTGNGVCVECLSNPDCNGNPNGDVCDTFRGFCVECVTQSDCVGHPDGEVCDTTNGDCLECMDSNDCVGNPNGDTCDPSTHTCTTCVGQGCLAQGLVCGTHDDGCGRTLDCNTCGVVGTCHGDGMDCDCPEDGEEPNNSNTAATDLGSFTDDPDSSLEVPSLSINTDTDEDWFVMEVQDVGFFGNPSVTVTVDNRSPYDPTDPFYFCTDDDSEYELTIWYLCNSGGDSPSCDDGISQPVADPTYGWGCSLTGDCMPFLQLGTSCTGTNETGTALVRVRKYSRYGRCDAYHLQIEVQ